ncbi:response regulator transcription factor [Calditerrivibrio nitroreducens]|uniref:Two component transcriptional regulator, winged helix family n=1 Tax=Calditerrivibrio nitroreducens (strain DSM 19672 / NBRC 101217 / Yu37-1) TaxID=768670 RepID=E4TIX8_CALNY|nr:response regulator transcription factor [Calditerrivibrio nitroreducens]ADR19110.1 two component transcriptional regulator, winged helix family [Calditerrivibrio nitroreducens DSM 19672]
MRVLIIEDDILLAESLKEYLNVNNFEAEVLSYPEEIYLVEHFDIILLDLMLKDKKGEYILREIRKKGLDLPIIVITAKSDMDSKEICFEYGADDYIVKPFDPKELLLRIKALTKRVYCCENLRIDNVLIDFSGKKLYVDDMEVHLSRIEWELLCLLAQNRGKLVTMDKILSYIWGDKVVGTESIRTYIKNLRKALPDDFIVTYKGRGYKLK